MLDQRRYRSLQNVEHLGVGTRCSPDGVAQVLVPWHRVRIPSPQQLDLHGLDRWREAEARFLAATKPLEISDVVAVHGDDQVEAGEVVRMDLTANMAEVVPAQPTLVRGHRIGKLADMPSFDAGGIELDALRRALSCNVVRYRVGGGRTTMVPRRNEQDAQRLSHRSSAQALGRKRRSRKLLVTTNKLETAMAALATIGDSSQAIASGIAATL